MSYLSYLNVQQLSKTYPERKQPALQPISFELQMGEVVTFLGESGSGKSTLLNLLAGLMDADEGEIQLAQTPIEGTSSKLVPGYEAIKLVKQGLKLSPNMKVWENIRYHLLRKTTAYQHHRIRELIQLCQLEGLEESFPRQLSGGQQQRVAIARAIANKPKLLLLDEPFSNLDSILKNQLLDALTHIIKSEEITSIFVMHDPYDALSISDRIGIMQHGRLIQLAKPQSIYHTPKNAYVSRMFGMPNILEAKQLQQLFPDKEIDSFTTACLRESAICIDADPTIGIKATVTQIKFLGDFWRIRLLVAEDFNLYANIPYKHSLQVGQFINIRVDWEKIHFFQDHHENEDI